MSPYQLYWESVKTADPMERNKIANKLLTLLQHMPRNLKKTESSIGTGLYMLASTIRHNCSPNVVLDFMHKDNTLSVIATKDIAKGEEVYILTDTIFNAKYFFLDISVFHRSFFRSRR